MSVFSREEHVAFEGYQEEEAEIIGSICRIDQDQDGEPSGTGATMEAEKRIRREIANSNERRRMQSINAGFQSLRTLLPHHEGEKLSKAAILQQTAEYIYSLEQEKTRLLSQNCQLKRMVHQHEGGELPPKKRKADVMITIKSESSDEGLGSMSPEPVNVINDSSELRRQLDRERGLRVVLEEQVRSLEAQIYQQQIHYTTTVEEPVVEEIALQLVEPENVPPVGHTQTVSCSPVHSRSPSPEPEQRLPSVLEAAIKAEPKVEVERLPSPNTPHDDRIYNTSRQNLETIVEAIRHLEGDHLFGDEPTQPQQEVPLALTTQRPSGNTAAGPDRRLQAEMNPFLQFHATSSLQQQQQSRPGVIVVKQQS